jgi:hypothetical protein
MKIKIVIEQTIITATLEKGGDMMGSVVSYPIEIFSINNPYRQNRAVKRGSGLFKKAGDGKWILEGEAFISRYADQVKCLYNHFPDGTATIEDLR